MAAFSVEGDVNADKAGGRLGAGTPLGGCRWVRKLEYNVNRVGVWRDIGLALLV